MKLNEFNDKLKIALKVTSPLAPKTNAYVSVNKLAEYMQATPTRRKQIIKTLKEDKDFGKVWYSEVKNVLPAYFKSGYDNSILENIIKKIEKKKVGTTWQDADNPNSIMALNCLKDALLPDLSDYEIVSDTEKIENVELGGIKVIIKPEMHLRNIHSGKMGGVKVHYSKTETNRLDAAGMQYVATMIKYAYLEMGYTEAQIDNNGCFSIDIFSQGFGTAPKAYKRQLDNLTNACEEIAARWVTL